MSKSVSFPREKVKILLLENINNSANAHMESFGYKVEKINKALSSEELSEKIADIHVLGIRSKTKVRVENLNHAKRLLAIGCFGVGTDQVDLHAAADLGIPVFNAPHSSTRSVAELSLGMIIGLARKVGTSNSKMHKGRWEKSAKNALEIRGKTLGLVGYGHIGQQVGLLAESVGMKVIFFDLSKRLHLGSAKPASSLENLLRGSDFISLHLPAIAGGKALMGKTEFSMMKPNSYVINISRGSLIDIDALKSAIESGHLAGAALDVFPQEPGTNSAEFFSGLEGCENVILTPHIGGSTQEAQVNIGLEVAKSFMDYIENGTSAGATNFPQINLPHFPDSHRILNVHKNEPGAAGDINSVLSDIGVNIRAQYLSTRGNIGYMVMDLDNQLSLDAKEKISALPSSIKTRILY